VTATDPTMAVLMLALALAAGSANIIDLPCTDISDPWACVAHTDLSLHAPRRAGRRADRVVD
jgi:hypothetical protein